MADTVNIPAPDLNGPKVANNVNFMDKYNEERDKRYKVGSRAYIDPSKIEHLKHFLDDPWIKSGTSINRPVGKDGHTKFLILGAGFGGILFAVKLIQAGFEAKDIVIIDPAGGFGGTWYWNRYPGLMCDTESYVYLPMLEEMGYMPKRKYASGEEIRLYAEIIAKAFGLHDRAQFQSSMRSATWDEEAKQWSVGIDEKPKGGDEVESTIKADFVMFASGVLNNAKLPDVDGLDVYKGHSFHTSRWDYNYTGGSISQPDLEKLKDKRVAYVGTGATAVQAVPELAKWAKELYVFQRTPSAVDKRDNRETDPQEWKSKIASKQGWQRERHANYHAFICNAPEKPEVDLVDDGWTKMPTYSALVGGPRTVTMENVGDYIGELHSLDYVRSERVRKRCEELVRDRATAESLKAWYPGWCKRPTFHDEYLQSFNKADVHLVDTAGKGISRLTASGPESDGQSYNVDVIIWGTGFVSPFGGSAAGRASVQVHGRNGVSLEGRQGTGDLLTLHGAVSRDFPNMFWPGPLQTGVSSNFVFTLEVMSTHIAHVIRAAHDRLPAGHKPIIEPTVEGQEEWANRVAATAIAMAGMAGCTPSYLNMEGAADKIPPEMQAKAARGSIWGRGIEDFCAELEKWRQEGSLRGLEISA